MGVGATMRAHVGLHPRDWPTELDAAAANAWVRRMDDALRARVGPRLPAIGPRGAFLSCVSSQQASHSERAMVRRSPSWLEQPLTCAPNNVARVYNGSWQQTRINDGWLKQIKPPSNNLPFERRWAAGCSNHERNYLL